ncbi:MAG: hypothetical protein ACE5D4_08700 [Thermodesulfobacteriota bacterium]
MSGMLSCGRCHGFHGQVKASKLPNAGPLADRFEISCKQTQRKIGLMRERLNAPLSYNPATRGYE